MTRTSRPDSDRCPAGLAIGGGAVMLVVVTLVAAAALPAVPGLSALAVAVGVFAALSGDGRAVSAIATLAWPFGNGFLLNQYGDLSWHHQDTGFVSGLLVAAALGMIVAPFLTRRPDRGAIPAPATSHIAVERTDLAPAAPQPREPADGEPLPALTVVHVG
ncbi:MAG: hypothetical protein QOI35_3234 [Cryptosporangiaceae bacterium]|nr:hypothetical protein [Cryptosporangiaceae bacterium]